jgi:hypothetical protein
MPRFLRYLRIAFSATCGIACVLFVVLCIRSYWRLDVLVRNNGSNSTIIRVDAGLMTLSQANFRSGLSGDDVWTLIVDNASWGMNYWQFDWARNKDLILVRIPVWVSAAALAVLGYTPWIRWSNRFSIRTMLIATTLIAAALAIIVSFNR